MLVKYTDYDYEKIYNKFILGEQERENCIRELASYRPRCKIKVKTIQSGDILESDIYPVWERGKGATRGIKKKRTTESVEKHNEMMARKQIVRLINENFSKNDLKVELTYPDFYLPTEERARADMRNYIRRVKTYRKQNNLPEMKYLYIVEYADEEHVKKIRYHHHIAMSKMDRDAAEEIWMQTIKGARCSCDRFQPDDYGLEGFARYLVKCERKIAHKDKGKNRKRWFGSRNLKKPKVNESVTKLSLRKANEIAKQPDNCEEIFRKMYKDKYRLLDIEIKYSEYICGYYIRARMRKRD